MSKYVVVVLNNSVHSVFAGSEEGWSDAHRAMYPGATFVFCNTIPVIGNTYNQETGLFEENPIPVPEEEVPVE